MSDEAQTIAMAFLGECRCGKGQCQTCLLAGELRRLKGSGEDIGCLKWEITRLTRELAEARSQRDGLVEALQIIADVPAVTPNGTLYYEVQSEDGQTGQMDVDPIGWVQHAGNKARAALDAAQGVA